MSLIVDIEKDFGSFYLKANIKQEKGVLGFLGESGCGKSMTLKCIAGIVKPDRGRIVLNGRVLFDSEKKINLQPQERKVGYLFQNYALFPHMTIKENIELIPKLKGDKSEEEISETTERLIKMVGLDPDEFLYKYPTELSGGQQQRIGVIRAIATDADIILMDEPFSALDPITRTQLQEWLYELQQELKKTIIFVTHDMDEALKLADKICIMQGGKIQQYDTAENLLKHPANSFVKDFIGSDRLWSAPEYIKAKDIMIKDPVKAIETRTVIQAMEIMRTNKVDSILVTDKNNLLVGILTVKELRQNGIQDYYIYKVMNQDPLFIYEDCNLIEILNIMNNQNVGHIPVVSKDGQLVGLITRSSLLSVLSEQFLEMEVSILG